MTLNQYFEEKYQYTPQADTLQDLVDEIIQISGIEIQYIPRRLNNLDEIFGEDRNSSYDTGYTIEVYPDDVQGFGGDGDFVSKFGLEIRDRINLTMSRRRFQQVIGSVEGFAKPREGDIIRFPFGNNFFHIHFVENEKPFYQFGSLSTYQLSCELMDYSDETFDTDIPEIDAVQPIYENENSVATDPFANNTDFSDFTQDKKQTAETNIFGNF